MRRDPSTSAVRSHVGCQDRGEKQAQSRSPGLPLSFHRQIHPVLKKPERTPPRVLSMSRICDGWMLVKSTAQSPLRPRAVRGAEDARGQAAFFMADGRVDTGVSSPRPASFLARTICGVIVRWWQAHNWPLPLLPRFQRFALAKTSPATLPLAKASTCSLPGGAALRHRLNCGPPRPTSRNAGIG